MGDIVNLRKARRKAERQANGSAKEFDPDEYLRQKSASPAKGSASTASDEDDWWVDATLIFDPVVGKKCNVEQTERGTFTYSVRTWAWWDGTITGKKDYERWLYVAISLWAFVPVGLLVGMNRWIRWLMR